MLNAHYVSSDLLCSVPLILILLQHQPYSEFPHVILYHLLAARSRLYSAKAVFNHIFFASDEQVSVSSQQFLAAMAWKSNRHRNACRFAASAHVHCVSNGLKWHLWASWGVSYPLLAVTCIEPY